MKYHGKVIAVRGTGGPMYVDVECFINMPFMYSELRLTDLPWNGDQPKLGASVTVTLEIADG